MFDKLDRQVQKYKQKIQDHHRGDKAANHMAG
jgi:putative sigma-54 modulation protein